MNATYIGTDGWLGLERGKEYVLIPIQGYPVYAMLMVRDCEVYDTKRPDPPYYQQLFGYTTPDAFLKDWVEAVSS